MRVEHAAAIGSDRAASASRGHLHLDIPNVHARETAPPADAGVVVRRLLPGGRALQHDTSENAHPAGAAVSGERHDRGHQTATPTETFAQSLNGILESCGEVQGRARTGHRIQCVTHRVFIGCRDCRR